MIYADHLDWRPIEDGLSDRSSDDRYSSALVARGVAYLEPPGCSSFMISPDMLVTAAHCLDGIEPGGPDRWTAEFGRWLTPEQVESGPSYDRVGDEKHAGLAFLRRRLIELGAIRPSETTSITSDHLKFTCSLHSYAPNRMDIAFLTCDPLVVEKWGERLEITPGMIWGWTDPWIGTARELDGTTLAAGYINPWRQDGELRDNDSPVNLFNSVGDVIDPTTDCWGPWKGCFTTHLDIRCGTSGGLVMRAKDNVAVGVVSGHRFGWTGREGCDWRMVDPGSAGDDQNFVTRFNEVPEPVEFKPQTLPTRGDRGPVPGRGFGVEFDEDLMERRSIVCSDDWYVAGILVTQDLVDVGSGVREAYPGAFSVLCAPYDAAGLATAFLGRVHRSGAGRLNRSFHGTDAWSEYHIYRTRLLSTDPQARPDQPWWNLDRTHTESICMGGDYLSGFMLSADGTQLAGFRGATCSSFDGRHITDQPFDWTVGRETGRSAEASCPRGHVMTGVNVDVWRELNRVAALTPICEPLR